VELLTGSSSQSSKRKYKVMKNVREKIWRELGSKVWVNLWHELSEDLKDNLFDVNINTVIFEIINKINR
jgi:hypothetical protein